MPKKKQNSKFKKFISWFKPTSPAKGALLFAIAFAVIGGSYMAYKSLAAVDYSRDLFQIHRLTGTAEIIVDKHSNKGEVYTWRLAGAKYDYDFRNGTVYTDDLYIDQSANHIISVCPWARGAINTAYSSSRLAYVAVKVGEWDAGGRFRIWNEGTLTFHQTKTYEKDRCLQAIVPPGSHKIAVKISNGYNNPQPNGTYAAYSPVTLYLYKVVIKI